MTRPAIPGGPTARSDPLEPVRRALLDRARRDAEAMLAEANAAAADTLRNAGAEARAIRENARLLGELDAESRSRADRARAHQEARRLTLGTQRELYEELRRAALLRAANVRNDPGYPAALERLAARARDALGPGATLSEDPSGGIVAETTGRRVAYTVEALLDEVLASQGARLEGLWRA